MTIANGKSIIKETIFENRFSIIDDLKKMGADIELKDSSTIVINGVKTLKRAEDLYPQDLRASFASIIAALIAQGTTRIMNTQYLFRGYEDVISKLSNIGVDIKLVEG